MLNIPKHNFYLNLLYNKARNTNVLALHKEGTTVFLDEAQGQTSNNIKQLTHLDKISKIEQYLPKFKHSIQPFYIDIKVDQAEMHFKVESRTSNFPDEYIFGLHPGNADEMTFLNQLIDFACVPTCNKKTTNQLCALQNLSNCFKHQYDIGARVSPTFLSYASTDITLNDIWNGLKNILQGKSVPFTWPCLSEAYIVFQLENIHNHWIYNIGIENETGYKTLQRRWLISEQIWNTLSTAKPIFQSDRRRSFLNGAEVPPKRTTSRLTECQHPFAKEILALTTL